MSTLSQTAISPEPPLRIFPITPPLLEVEGLKVSFHPASPVVRGVSFQLLRGECLALVGESGSGKSVTSRALVGLAGRQSKVEAVKLNFDGANLLRFGNRDWRATRGAKIGFVMQDATGSLDPLRLVGKEVGEQLEWHTKLEREQIQARVLELLRSVGVPLAELRARQYPHQLSGGLRQRALIASAIACDPDLLIADEPTTALDALVQGQVLDLLETLRQRDRAMIIVSHDLGVVARLAHRIAVMQHGVIVEQGTAEQILQAPQHPYTRSLLNAASAIHLRCDRRRDSVSTPQPTPAQPAATVHAFQRQIIMEATGVSKSFHTPDGERRTAVANASFTLGVGETIGIVGESGSGKTTLTRMILGLENPDRGEIHLRGRSWRHLNPRERRTERRRMQVVFQNPLASFDPRYTVERVLGEALSVVDSPRRNAAELLHLVRLPTSILSKRPIEISGGQIQRVAIARALAAQPEVLVCDEPVSALDASVQAQILELLNDLKHRLKLSCLFISHDLGVIRHISDRIIVMKDGEIVEAGSVHDVFTHPQHEYTRALLGAIPHLPSMTYTAEPSATEKELYAHA